ncbi:MAG: alpha/beta hydrolase, partial [Ruminococcaceae bacterium]|nr:alpha/beta hydrolase [Oscillospiraceae bacterium]
MKQFRTLKCNPFMDGQAEFSPDIVYSSPDGKPLIMHLMTPWKNEANKDRRYPLIVYTEGGGWATPWINFEIPQLAQYAREGYVVATIIHRDVYEGHPFPAFLQDLKCAIRFLRAHAEEYKIDPSRVVVMGASAGANASMLAALTGDDPRYKTEDYADESDAVSAVVECFGPADMFTLYDNLGGDDNPNVIRLLTGGNPFTDEAAREKAIAMSPCHIVADGRKYPPFLMFHGVL